MIFKKPSHKRRQLNFRKSLILEVKRNRTMQAYKINGKIDNAGNLVITEPVQIPAGDVEVIILQTEQVVFSNTEHATKSQQKTSQRPTKIKALQGWFEKTQPVSPDFDPDEARWEALKEKYNL
jgi:hypothetical protein